MRFSLWSSYVQTMTSIWQEKNYFALILLRMYSNFILEYAIHFMGSGRLAHTYEITYCEMCQLQFYLKPDGLLCSITLAYQHNHLSIAFED